MSDKFHLYEKSTNKICRGEKQKSSLVLRSLNNIDFIVFYSILLHFSSSVEPLLVQYRFVHFSYKRANRPLQ